MQAFFHLFIHTIAYWDLLCTKYFSMHLRYINVQNRQNSGSQSGKAELYNLYHMLNVFFLSSLHMKSGVYSYKAIITENVLRAFSHQQ